MFVVVAVAVVAVAAPGSVTVAAAVVAAVAVAVALAVSVLVLVAPMVPLQPLLSTKPVRRDNFARYLVYSMLTSASKSTANRYSTHSITKDRGELNCASSVVRSCR